MSKMRKNMTWFLNKILLVCAQSVPLKSPWIMHWLLPHGSMRTSWRLQCFWIWPLRSSCKCCWTHVWQGLVARLVFEGPVAATKTKKNRNPTGPNHKQLVFLVVVGHHCWWLWLWLHKSWARIQLVATSVLTLLLIPQVLQMNCILHVI